MKMKIFDLVLDFTAISGSLYFQVVAYSEFWNNNKLDAIFHLGVALLLYVMYSYSNLSQKLGR